VRAVLSSEFQPKWTYVLIGVNVLVFMIQNATDAWFLLVFVPALGLARPWTFVTTAFLHANVTHLLFNMIALFFFGTYLERMVGRWRFLVIYFLAAIVGNLGYLLTASDLFIPAVGASGAVYGVMGALAMLTPFLMVFVMGFLPLPMIIAVVLWGTMDFFGLFAPSGIAHGAHLGGLFVGVLVGLYVKRAGRRLISYR
jgi:membrane associated rhomboid family serine protease